MFIVGGVKSIVSAVKSIVRPLTMDFLFRLTKHQNFFYFDAVSFAFIIFEGGKTGVIAGCEALSTGSKLFHPDGKD